MTIKELKRAIEYQLRERMQFVKPPDAAVASLLFDYAAIEAATVTLESAKQVLEMAVEYGYPTAKVQPLMKVYDQRIFRRKLKGYGLIALCVVAAFGLLAVLYRRGIFVLSRKGSQHTR